MYLEHYNITGNPFDTDKDKTSLWLGGNLPNIATALKEAIMENKGIVALTGDAGTGKRTAIKMITDILQDQFIIATFFNPELTGLDFYNVLSTRFNFTKRFNSKSAFLVHLRNFLRHARSINKKILLIISDADKLKIKLFEDLTLLSEIELNDRKMISILLVGRKRWVEASVQKNMKRISSQIALICSLDPLNEAETAEYVQFCLDSVGANKKLFSDESLREVFSFSQGNLNLVNTICDLALRRGFLDKKKRIGAGMVNECKNELKEQGIVGPDVTPFQKFVIKHHPDEELDAYQTPPSPKRWLWIKALFVLLFIFSSYVLYKSQTEKMSTWKTGDIAHKDYDFHKLKEEDNISPESVQGTNQDSSESNADKQSLSQNSPEIENQDFEALSAAKRKSSARLSTFHREWPFSTYKKIIYFQYDSNSLSPESLEILDKIADFAVHNPADEFLIKGYTDSTGADSYNLTVSKFRANSVKSYLIAKGVNPSKLSVYGLGSKNPIFSNRTVGGRKLNRRVEIELKLD